MGWLLFKKTDKQSFLNKFMIDLVKEIKLEVPALQIRLDKSFNQMHLRLHSESFSLVCRFTSRLRGLDFDAWDYRDMDERFEIFNVKTTFNEASSSTKERYECMQYMSDQARPHIKAYIIEKLKIKQLEGGNYNETKQIESN